MAAGKKPTFWNLEADIMKPQNKTIPQTGKVYWAPTAGLQGTVSWPGRAVSYLGPLKV